MTSDNVEKIDETNVDALVDQAIGMADSELSTFLQTLSKPVLELVTDRLAEIESLDEFPTVVGSVDESTNIQSQVFHGADSKVPLGESLLDSTSTDASFSDVATILKTAAFIADKYQEIRAGGGMTAEPMFGDRPYSGIDHSLRVAAVLAQHGQVDSIDLLQAALLSDLVSNLITTVNEITLVFGSGVSLIVGEFVDGISSNPETSSTQFSEAPFSEAQLDLISRKSPAAKQLFVADSICKMEQITLPTGSDGGDKGKGRLVDHCKQVVDLCRSANPNLARYFDQILQQQITS